MNRGHAEVHRKSDAVFVGEQDGPVEVRLKEALMPTLRTYTERAYLVRTMYPNSFEWHVSLCVVSQASAPELVRRIGEVFAGIFASNQYMDIVFIDESQEARVAAVCRPFYVGAR